MFYSIYRKIRSKSCLSIWSGGMNSCWPSELEKIEMFLTFDLACLTSFGHGEDGVSIDETVFWFWVVTINPGFSSGISDTSGV